MTFLPPKRWDSKDLGMFTDQAIRARVIGKWGGGGNMDYIPHDHDNIEELDLRNEVREMGEL
jgi:hypothetical protein